MRIGRALLCVGFVVIPVTQGLAQCRSAAVAPCGIDLKGEGAPRLTGSCGDEAWKGHLSFDLPERFADADGNGWHEVVMQLDLDPKLGCRCAVFRIHYEGTPKTYTVNIGDSPTNNGHGGDSWTTRFDAELMIHETNLSAFGAELPGSGSEAPVFGLTALPIADRVLELVFCDQSVQFEIDPAGEFPGLGGYFNTHRSRELISIVAPGDDVEADAPDSRIYAAFNRVIHRRGGRPSQNRFGSGVRRVEISLTP